MTFDETLSSLLAMIGERVDVHVHDAGQNPHLVATFGGRLQAAHSMTGGEPSPGESIYVRLEEHGERAAILFDRELFGDGMQHPDGAITVRFGGVELLISRRESE